MIAALLMMIAALLKTTDGQDLLLAIAGLLLLVIADLLLVNVALIACQIHYCSHFLNIITVALSSGIFRW